MRKRLLSVLLCLCMVTSLLPAGAVRAMAVGPQNRYGHSIIYTPVEQLKVNGRSIRLMDAGNHFLNDVLRKGRNEGQQVEYLTRNGYNLNWFLTLNKQKTQAAYINSFRPASLDYSGGWPRVVYGEPNLSDHFEGWIDIHDQTTSRYWAHYDAEPALYTPVEDGRNNIYNMVDKGDLMYIFPHKTQTVDAAFGSEDTCAVEILGRKREYSGKGGHAYRYDRSGIDLYGPWSYEAAYQLESGLHFYGHSNWDDENDAYMHSGILVGRDSKGPRIKSVTLTRDPAGKEPIRGAIGMDLVASLQDRTLYFQVEWDEPVRFRPEVTLADLAKLELKIQTSGKDNGSAMPMSAPFYSFAPETMDGTPVMTFEYRILDPYDESSPDLELAKKRGDYYTINRLAINAAENKELFHNIVDLSNNPLGCDIEGNREDGMEVACDVSGAPYVDLRPLVITGVRVQKPHDQQYFVKKGDILTIALDFNKPLDTTIFEGASGARDPENVPERVPVMTLNLLDKDGKPVVLRAGTGVTYPKMEYRDGAWVQEQDEDKNPVFHTYLNSKDTWAPMPPVYQDYSWHGGHAWTLRYSLPFYPDAEHQYRLPEGETSVRVVSIDAAPGGIVDAAGYSLPSYKLDRASGTLLPVVSELPAPVQGYVNAHQDQANKPYQVSPDRQYRLDFDDPVVEPELYMADVQNRIVGIRANITDRNLAGCSVNYCISFQGAYEGKLQYQSSASENWTESWVDANVGYGDQQRNVVSFSGAITPTSTGGIANGFLKLPETVEFANVKATLTVSDEAENTTTSAATREGALLDNVAPRIHSIYETSERLSAEEVITSAEVEVEEYSAYRALSYAWTKPGEPEPAESAFKPAPLPAPGRYGGMYSHIPGPTKEDIGNRIDTRTLWFKATDEHGNSRTRHEDLSFDCRTPEIKVTFEGNVAHLSLQHPDAKYFWWGVLEKPANYVVDGVDYRDPVSYIRAMGLDKELAVDYVRNSDQMAGSRHSGSEGQFPLAPNGEITYRDYTITRAAKANSYSTQYGEYEPFGDSERLKWEYGGSLMDLDVMTENHRPLLLVVGANDYDISAGQVSTVYELEAFEVPAIGPQRPEIKARQVRFSSNDRDGVRQDHIRTGLKDDIGQGLVWADDPTCERTDYPRVLNVPALHDFAEAEFYLAGDPVIGLAGLDLQKSQIRLDKVIRDGGWALFPGTSDSPKWNRDGRGNRELLQKWSLQSVGMDQIAQGSMEEFQQGMTRIGGQKICADNAPLYSFVLSLDPNMFSTTALHQKTDYNGAEVVFYEFSFLPVYTDGTQGSGESVAFFAFENDPAVPVKLVEFKYKDEDYHGGLGGHPEHDAQLVLDEQGRDVTENVPVCNIGLPEDGTTSFFPVFQVDETMDGSYMFFASSPNEGKLGVDPLVRWGTDPAHLDKVSRTEFHKGAPTKTTDSLNLAAGETLRLYYQADDAIQGGKQPIRVVDVYRDAIPPVVEFKASELDQKVPEVTFRLDTAYDGHWVGEGEDRHFVVDTPSEELLEHLDGYAIRAERFPLPGDPRDPDYPADDPDYPPEMIRVKPDENGVYHFPSNGTISVYASHISDRAGNSLELLINGKPFPQNEWGDYELQITNVDTLPPNIVTAPQYTVDKATGSFTVTAQVDDPTASAYLRFDDAYTTYLTGIEAPADPGLFPDTYRLISLDSGPGVMKKDPVTVPAPQGGTMEVIPGAVDENGKISAKVYVKYGEQAPAAASVTLVVRDGAGHQAESKPFTLDLAGVKPAITNAPNANSGTLPAYEYGRSLSTNVPVSIPELDLPLGTSHSGLPLYGDGPVDVTARDLFGTGYAFRFYGDIFGPAYRHRITFKTADGKEILPSDVTNQDVTVTIDTSATPGLTVNGKETLSQRFTANGTLSYRLKAPGLGEKAFEIQVNCIDKTAPEATVSVERTGPQEDSTKAYSVTCKVEGFSEPDVTMLPNAGDGTVSRTVTFDKDSANRTYTFRFQDKAGNIGTCTVSAADYQFVEQVDRRIAAYRLTYTKNGADGQQELFNVLMDASADSGDYPLPALIANTDISVSVEALNAAGKSVPCTMTEESKTSGTLVFPEVKNIIFDGESTADREAAVKLKSDENEVRFRVKLPGGSIDTTAPTGSISFVPQGEDRRVYLDTTDTDLAQNGVTVRGQQVDGQQFVLEQDAEGSYFVTLTLNGKGQFLLRDKAGNTGSVSFSVVDIDKEAPYIQHEAWSGTIEAAVGQLAELLKTPTNSSIFAFFTFNEQLGRVEATAYDQKGGKVLSPQSDYVTVVNSGNTLTVEFKQNCQVHLVAYDLKGNSYELWRPEDGPITVIDKVAPELEGEPQVRFAQNKVTYTYTFKNGEEVTLTNSVGDRTAGPKPVYQNQQVVTFDKNGQYTLTFADRAGNVLSVHPLVDQIDELAPEVSMAMDVADKAHSGGGVDSTGKPYYYTSGNVYLYLNVQDTSGVGSVTAHRMSSLGTAGSPVPVEKGHFTLENVQSESGVSSSTFNYRVTVEENGVYEIVAADQWGHSTTIRPSVNSIDRTAPAIGFQDSRPVFVPLNTAGADVESAVMQGVTVSDTQSGKGSVGKEKKPAVTLSVDLSGVDVTARGTYQAVITARDLLGNTSTKTRAVVVTEDGFRSFRINGVVYAMNDICSLGKGQTIEVELDQGGNPRESINYYWAKGHLTTAQMKYADSLTGPLTLEEEGYYTILAQSAERGMYVVYVYAY